MIGGGPAVVFQHANRLKKRGYDVSVINVGTHAQPKADWFTCAFPIINWDISCDKKFPIKNIDIAIATHFSTVKIVKKINAKRKLYFIQSDERRFDLCASQFFECQNSYKSELEFFTMARWIQRWLKEEFNQDAYYVPNGLDEKIFFPTRPIKPKSQKPRILLEGPIDVPFKGMDDAYRAVKNIDCELWIVSSAGKPKIGWRYDRFFEKVPMEKMKEVYSSCDIILKMSKIESFSYPPLEAMACGCAPVVADYTGFDEYIVDGENALVVKIGDVQGAKEAVQKLIDDSALREKMKIAGKKTAQEWSWNKSMDYLEKVLHKEDIMPYYTNDFPKRYDFSEVMHYYKDRVMEESAKTIIHLDAECNRVAVENAALQHTIDSIRQELHVVYASRFWKLRAMYMTVKHYVIFIFLNPKKFVVKVAKAVKRFLRGSRKS